MLFGLFRRKPDAIDDISRNLVENPLDWIPSQKGEKTEEKDTRISVLTHLTGIQLFWKVDAFHEPHVWLAVANDVTGWWLDYWRKWRLYEAILHHHAAKLKAFAKEI